MNWVSRLVMGVLPFYLFTFLPLEAQAENTYDQDKPFGFCTVSSRTDASKTYALTGGGCYTYPIPEGFTGKVQTLKSNGQDMKGTIQNAIKQNDVVILDGSDGEFIVSSNVGVTSSNKTIIGINGAKIRTKWYVTDELKQALNDAGVSGKSTTSGGGTLPNGQTVSEDAEYYTRKIIIERTGDTEESYRNAGILSLIGCQNIIIRNIIFQGPGSIDVGGADLISSTNGAKNIWVDHCNFMDGEDGNFDITQKSDFHTVSWCTFGYTSRSYMHQNTNLIGSSDSETTGYLNTTFSFCWWQLGCKQRMPMARVGKIHMLNNYFTCTSSSNCINPRKNSEFLIEGNYFAKNVKKFYGEDGATAVTWSSTNHITSGDAPSSKGNTVTVPYTYGLVTAAEVPAVVEAYAGATLFDQGGGGEEPEGVMGTIYWPMSSNTDAQVSESVASYIGSPSVSNGSNLDLRTHGTYGNVRFSLFQAQEIQASPDASNAVTFSFTTLNGHTFKATSVEFMACKVGTNTGNIDVTWKDGGTEKKVLEAAEPNRNNQESGYYSNYILDVSKWSTATNGTCSLIINIYNVGALKDNAVQKKDIGLAEVIIKGNITDVATGIETPVTFKAVQDNTYYNLSGQRVEHPTKGLYIVNGKKVIIKR